MLKNPVVQALAGGVANAAAIGGPLLDDGVKASDVCAIVVAFIVGAGLTRVAPAARRA